MSTKSKFDDQTDIEVAHPSVVFYDFYAAWNKPILNDTEAYIGKLRSYATMNVTKH